MGQGNTLQFVPSVVANHLLGNYCTKSEFSTPFPVWPRWFEMDWHRDIGGFLKLVEGSIQIGTLWSSLFQFYYIIFPKSYSSSISQFCQFYKQSPAICPTMYSIFVKYLLINLLGMKSNSCVSNAILIWHVQFFIAHRSVQSRKH